MSVFPKTPLRTLRFTFFCPRLLYSSQNHCNLEGYSGDLETKIEGSEFPVLSAVD